LAFLVEAPVLAAGVSSRIVGLAEGVTRDVDDSDPVSVPVFAPISAPVFEPEPVLVLVVPVVAPVELDEGGTHTGSIHGLLRHGLVPIQLKTDCMPQTLRGKAPMDGENESV